MPKSITTIFREHFPDEFLRRAFRGLFDACRLAHEESQQFEYPEAVNFEWALRRAKVHTLAAAVSSQVPGVVAVPSRGDKQPSPWWHRRIQHGRAILTFHSAPDPDFVLPKSMYRQQYVDTTTRQRSLFEIEDNLALLKPDDWIVYAMWLYGRGSAPRGQLGFSVLRFPLRDVEGYWVAKIDLFKEFPDIVAEMRPDIGGKRDDRDDDGFDLLEGEDWA